MKRRALVAMSPRHSSQLDKVVDRERNDLTIEADDNSAYRSIANGDVEKDLLIVFANWWKEKNDDSAIATDLVGDHWRLLLLSAAGSAADEEYKGSDGKEREASHHRVWAREFFFATTRQQFAARQRGEKMRVVVAASD